MKAIKEQLWYVKRTLAELTEAAFALDAGNKARLVVDDKRRYESTDCESAARRCYGELDELAQAIEAEAKRQEEEKAETAIAIENIQE